MKGKKLTIFVRFGGLNIKKQKGFTSDEDKSFHSPPTTKGFYAMPKVAQELFLIGAMDSYQPGTTLKPLKGDALNHLPYEEQIKIYQERGKRWSKSISLMRKEFTKTQGNIWHHLEEFTDRNEILETNGAWVKTSIKAWEKAFGKMSVNQRLPSGNDYIKKKNINEAKGILGGFSNDHCEVFFDEKV